MEQNKGNITISYFIGYSIIILIGFYLIASIIVSFLPVNPQTFAVTFTLSGGIPALTLLFNEKYVTPKKIRKNNYPN